MAVLLLLFLYEGHGDEGWVLRFGFLLLTLGSSLAFIRLAALETLSKWWVQATIFVADAILASLILQWMKRPSDLYLLYFLIIFGTALTRNFIQSFLIGIVTSVLYLLSAWSPGQGFPSDASFWLRVNFLWVSTSLLAILARDAQDAQQDQVQKYQDRLVQMERLATLGRVAGEVAHRIKAPLTTILVNAEVLSQRRPRSKEASKEIREIQEEVAHCKAILKNLLDLGRIEEMTRVRFDLREPVLSAIESIRSQTLRRGIQLATQGLGSPCGVSGDPSLLYEAVQAVLQNAIEATPRGGRIQVELRPRPSLWAASRAPYEIIVEDTGRGIERANLERIFQPFFTTRPRDGTGLGLSAALRTLQKHKGTIEAHSEGPGRGARFTLVIPRK